MTVPSAPEPARPADPTASGADPGRPPAALPRPTGSTAERRIASVLFADLVGFTPLAERLDAEDVAAIQDAWFAHVRETVCRHGGAVEKFIGDAAMAVFGLDRTREDDAERCVRAGLALIAGIERLCAVLGLDEGELRLRVGIDTGEVVTADAGPDQGRVTGDTVNTGARLQAAAPPGGVLLDETTALAVAHVVDLGPAQPYELKGKSAPVRASLALGLRPEGSRERALGRLRAPLVGRREDLAAIATWIGEAPAGNGRVLLLVAPPGVGKSRCTAVAVEEAEAEGAVGRVLRARLRPGSGPVEGIADLVRSALGDAGAIDDLATRLTAAGTLSAGRAEVVGAAILGLLDAHPMLADEGRARADAWLDGLDALTAGLTTLWYLEDLHWAADDLLAFVEAATDRPVRGAGRRLVLATSRPSLLERWGRAQETGPSGSPIARRDLPPLAPTSAAELITALVGDAVPPALAKAIAERSDGNPLFIEELLRTWVAAGILVAESGPAAGPAGAPAWRLAVPEADVVLPASVQAIYAAQVDDLPERERQVVRRGSVAGRWFPVAALPSLDVPQPDAAVAALLEEGLIAGPRADLLGDAYAYRHALLRDAGYASLARAERSRLHVRLARWLEWAAQGREQAVADVIGGHYEAALESAPRLSATIGDDLTRADAAHLAARWLEHGADRARVLTAMLAASDLYRRSLALTPHDQPLARARRLARLGDVMATSGSKDEAAPLLDEAAALFRAALATGSSADRRAARDGLSLALLAQAHLRHEQLHFREAERTCLEGLEQLGPPIGEGPDVPAARLAYYAALARHSETDADTSEPLRAALETARAAGDRRLELEIWSALSLVAEETEAGSADWDGVAELARALDDHDTLISALTNAIFRLGDSHPDTVLARCDEVESIAEAHGLTEQLAWTDYMRTEALAVSGDWERLLRVGLRGIDRAERHGYRRAAVRAYHLVAPVALARGERAPLERLAAFYAGHEGAFPDSPYSRIIKTAMDLHVADAGLAETFVPEPGPRMASFQSGLATASWIMAVERIVGAWLDAGLLEDGRTALEHLGGHRDDRGTTELGRAAIDLMGARLARASGAGADAVEALARASLARSRPIPAPWWVARALALLASIGRADASEAAEVAALADTLGVDPDRLGRWCRPQRRRAVRSRRT